MLKKSAFSFIFLVLGISISAIAHAQSDSDTLSNLLLGITTMQADFTQAIQDKSAKSLQQARGHFALRRPGKFRWETTQPVAQLIIANGSRLWIYDPDLEQVTVRNFSSSAGQTPALLLSDKNLTLSKDFIVKQVANPSQIAGAQIFLLKPKDKDNLFTAIKLSFIQKQINEMQIEDHLGHLTTIRFQHVKSGIPLSSSLFTFTPPAKVDVIDETKNKYRE